MDGSFDVKKTYETPSIKVLGTLRELTASLNKVGRAADTFSTEDNNLTGSLVTAP
jgi:hypothetical protein